MLQELEYENSNLKKLLNFKAPKNYKYVASHVIGRNATSWVGSITIDRGTIDGIRPGMPVVDGAFAVGQVVAVSSRSSEVLLLSSQSSSIGVIVQRTRVPAIVEGRTGTKLLPLNYLSENSDVKVGDVIITSGMDSIFPKGIVVGTVKRVLNRKASLFKDVIIMPGADSNLLENVLVLAPE